MKQFEKQQSFMTNLLTKHSIGQNRMKQFEKQQSFMTNETMKSNQTLNLVVNLSSNKRYGDGKK